MVELAVHKPFESVRISVVLIGPNGRTRLFGNDACNQFHHASLCGLWVRAAVLRFEMTAFQLLCGAHGSASAEFGIVEAVYIVRYADQKVEIEGPVLTVFKGSKTVEDEWFFRRSARA